LDNACKWNWSKDKCYKKRSSPKKMITVVAEPSEYVAAPSEYVAAPSVYKPSKLTSRKLSHKKKRTECPGHTRKSCPHHQGCRWNSKRKSCGVKRRSSRRSSRRTHRKISIIAFDPTLTKKVSKRVSKSDWKQHWKKYAARHPELNFKEVLRGAKKTYLRKSLRKSRSN